MAQQPSACPPGYLPRPRSARSAPSISSGEDEPAVPGPWARRYRREDGDGGASPDDGGVDLAPAAAADPPRRHVTRRESLAFDLESSEDGDDRQAVGIGRLPGGAPSPARPTSAAEARAALDAATSAAARDDDADDADALRRGRARVVEARAARERTLARMRAVLAARREEDAEAARRRGTAAALDEARAGGGVGGGGGTRKRGRPLARFDDDELGSPGSPPETGRGRPPRRPRREREEKRLGGGGGARGRGEDSGAPDHVRRDPGGYTRYPLDAPLVIGGGGGGDAAAFALLPPRPRPARRARGDSADPDAATDDGTDGTALLEDVGGGGGAGGGGRPLFRPRAARVGGSVGRGATSPRAVRRPAPARGGVVSFDGESSEASGEE